MNYKIEISKKFNQLKEALTADRYGQAFTICGELKKLIFSYYEDNETNTQLALIKKKTNLLNHQDSDQADRQEGKN